MATSPGPIPTVCMTRGMSFAPSNGVAAVERKAQIEAQIREAREQAEKEARKYTRTSKGKSWGRS